MAQLIKTFGRIGVLLCLLAAAACSSPTATSTPTIDLDPVRTQVAATVLAQVTLDLLSTPSITPIPSPNATSTSTVTSASPASPSPSPTGALPLLTGTPGTPVSGADRAQWVSQSVADGTIFAPGETFTMTWTLKNVGTSTWTAVYMLRHFAGETFGAATELPLGKEVPPGGTVDFSLKMTAPARGGNFQSDWVMATGNRSNFREGVFLKIIVAVTPTPTR
jgi:hypothetical protein